jgi:cytochrome c oxidase cbb3-type subunit II
MAFLTSTRQSKPTRRCFWCSAFLVVTIGGIVQIVPLFYLENTIEKVEGVRPYTPLELAGREIYIREGCYVCHSQMIRPMRDEVERYGHYSWRPSRCTTIRSSGGPSAPGRTWPASAAAIRTTGTSTT